MTQHAPSFTAAKLYEKTSAKGGTYFTGRLGGVKVTLLKSRETAEDGGAVWELKFAEAAPFKPRAEGDGATADRSPGRERPKTSEGDKPVTSGGRLFDDRIPFLGA